VRYRLLALDYDETLAMEGRLNPAAAGALAEAARAGWRLVLVTGRPCDEIAAICSPLDLFDLVVSENGCVLHRPADGTVEVLATGPVGVLRDHLAAAGVDFIAGRVVTITRRAEEPRVRRLLERRALPFECFGNRPALMIVPRGTSKATGLAAALERVGVAPGEAVAVGDDENDLPLFETAGLRVAVGNAVEVVKSAADLVLEAPNGEGVATFVRRCVAGDLPIGSRGQGRGEAIR